MNYTKGEWKLGETLRDHNDDIFWHTSVVRGGIRVARSTGIGEDEAFANAQLISAAPDLYEALKEARKELKAWVKDHGECIATNDVINSINKAIAKAEGK